MRPKSYHLPHECRYCAHRQECEDYYGKTSYHCRYKPDKEPTQNTWHWTKWIEKRSVDPRGTCDKFLKEDE
jgi:hypothetical protein